MKLKDFIRTVIVDIELGVNEAAGETRRRTFLKNIDFKGTGSEGIEFDVAVTSSKEASGKVGAEVLSLGAKTEGKISSEEVSRVKFKVNVGDYFKK
jgi:hypothetical protein